MDCNEAELRRKFAAQPCGGRISYASTPVLKASIESDIIEQIIAYCYQQYWLDDQYFALRYLY